MTTYERYESVRSLSLSKGDDTSCARGAMVPSGSSTPYNLSTLSAGAVIANNSRFMRFFYAVVSLH